MTSQHSLLSTIPRPRLLERLEEGMERPLTVLCAPAGYGKSTLLGQWAPRGGRPVARVALDEGDGDPQRCLGRVVAALRAAWPGLSVQAAAGPCSPTGSGEEALIPLLNAIARAPQDLALVLDYGRAAGAPALGPAADLVDRLPPQLHLFLASRAEPLLPLARLRMRGQLGELRTADLRFTPAEAAAFLHSVGHALTDEEVAALVARTEGWIGGLARAAEALRGERSVAGSVESFSGSHPVLARFFAELLARELPPVQAFLLRTSPLDRLAGPLCDHVTGRRDGQAMLEMLERANLFVVPLDGERRWYRYHRLFAEFLRDCLCRSQPEAAAEIRRRAAEWQGLGRRAV